MTTATPPRPPQTPTPRPGPAPAGAGAGMAPIDPIKLIKQYAPLLVTCFVIGAVLGAAAHLVLQRVAPRYTSFALYEIFPPEPDPTVIDQSNFNQDELDRFMGTQVQIILSDQVLQNAVRDPAVEEQTTWAKQFGKKGQAYVNAASRELQKRLTARVLSNTNIIRVSLTGSNANDVATIVNAVHRAYFEDMFQRDSMAGVDKRQVLARMLNDKREAIRGMTLKRDRLVDEGGLESPEMEAQSASMEAFKLAEKVVEARAMISIAESQLNEYISLLQDGRVLHYPDRIREAATQDPIIKSIDSAITDLKALERQLLLDGRGENHSEVKSVRSMIEAKTQERQVKHEATMRALFDAAVDEMKATLAAYQAQLRDIEQKMEIASARRRELLKKKLEVDELNLQIEQANKAADELDATIKTMESRRELKVANRVRVLRLAQTPTSMSFPKAIIMIPAGAVLLPSLVGGIVLLREIFDQRVRSTADVAIIPRLRVLGVVPDAAEDPARPANVATAYRDAPLGAVTESFRQVRAPIIKKMEQMGHKSLLVVAGMPGSGATSVVSNLGMIAAASDQRVLIVDANLRRPGVHKLFNLAEGPGLGDVLAGAATLESAAQPTDMPNLSVLSAGSAENRRNPERLATDAMANLLREAGASYDLVLIDSAPAVVSGDAASMANLCDASILVVRALSEKRGLVARLQNQFAEARAELLGVILNGARSSAGGYLKRNIDLTHKYQKAKA